MTPPTPCQKCKADLAEGRQLVLESTEKLLRAAARIVELEALLAKRHECPNCGPCPCTETD
jgi:hypothetical protein